MYLSFNCLRSAKRHTSASSDTIRQPRRCLPSVELVAPEKLASSGVSSSCHRISFVHGCNWQTHVWSYRAARSGLCCGRRHLHSTFAAVASLRQPTAAPLHVCFLLTGAAVVPPWLSRSCSLQVPAFSSVLTGSWNREDRSPSISPPADNQ